MSWRQQILAHADEYRHLAEITGAGKYPADNTCNRCGRASDRPLIPSRHGWRCWPCSYADRLGETA